MGTWTDGLPAGKRSWSRFNAFVTGKLAESAIAASLHSSIDEMIVLLSYYTDTALCVGKSVYVEVEAFVKQTLADAACTYLTGMLVSIISDATDKMERRSAVNEELALLEKLSLSEAMFHKTLVDQIAKVRACA